MSSGNQIPTIIEIKKQIQSIVSNLMSNSTTQITEDQKKLIQQISKYKVANNLEDLSKAFGNVLDTSQATNPDS